MCRTVKIQISFLNTPTSELETIEFQSPRNEVIRQSILSLHHITRTLKFYSFQLLYALMMCAIPAILFYSIWQCEENLALLETYLFRWENLLAVRKCLPSSSSKVMAMSLSLFCQTSLINPFHSTGPYLAPKLIISYLFIIILNTLACYFDCPL